MISILVFPIIAAGLVFLAGRKDAARDPKLTVSLLLLLGAIPVMTAVMPKVGIFPAVTGMAREVGFPWAKVLPWVWAVGFIVAMARLGLAAAGLKHWRKRATEVARVDGISVCVLEDLQGPVAAGIVRPVILVPTSWNGWPDDRKRVVLEHELAHHRRRDPFWRLLAELACAVHWYHPLAHWMKRRFILQCEYACDARVLDQGIDPRIYASVLCEFASEHSPCPFAPAMAATGSLESRVRRMLKPADGLSERSLAVFALLGVITACSLSMIGHEIQGSQDILTTEAELRLTANPFPAGP